MKAVLISVQPKWCEMIANDEKTIEVRKTKPKIDTPFKCYMYCTKPKSFFSYSNGLYTSNEYLHLYHKKITMSDGFEFCCEEDYDDCQVLNSKVIGEFMCHNISEYFLSDYDSPAYDISDDELNSSCLHQEELYNYGHGATLYGWHISNLVIYDKPKELKDFKYHCINDCERCRYSVIDAFQRNDEDVRICDNYINRPPQSWCYVEEHKSSKLTTVL